MKLSKIKKIPKYSQLQGLQKKRLQQVLKEPVYTKKALATREEYRKKTLKKIHYALKKAIFFRWQ